MTDAQFTALSKLIRLRASPSAEAARLMLVRGMSRNHAAERAGCTADAARKAAARVQSALDLARIAAG